MIAFSPSASLTFSSPRAQFVSARTSRQPGIPGCRHARRRISPVMTASTPSSAPSPSTTTAAPAPAGSPTTVPEGMTNEWFEAIVRIQTAVPSATFDDADEALVAADGDELDALAAVTAAARSPLMERREAAAAAAGEGRVSAMKEAEMRRAATGSARQYFKGFVEVKGDCVENGIVDEEADVVKAVGDKLKGWFGGKK